MTPLISDRHKELFAKGALLSAALIWGISFVILKDAIEVIPPLTTIGIRFLVAFILLSALFRKKFRLINKDYVVCGICAGLILGLAYGVQTIGLDGTTPGKNAFLTSGYCIITPFLFWLISGKRPSSASVAAAFICMTGFGLISLDSSLGISQGDLLSILCGFFYAAHISYVGKVYGDKDPVLFSIIQFGVAALGCLAAGFLLEGPPGIIPLSIVPQLLFLSVVATAGGLLLQSIGQKYASPSAASLLLSLESVFGVGFSLILYDDEKLTLRLAAGFLLVFTAIIISEVIGGSVKNDNKNENIHGKTLRLFGKTAQRGKRL